MLLQIFIVCAIGRIEGRKVGLSHAAKTFSRSVPGYSDINSRADPESVVSVLNFGAVGDGVSDNTAAFAAAVAAVSSGGLVYVPSGQFSFHTVVPCGGVVASICLTKGVSLVGTFQTVPSHNMGQGGSLPVNGSILLPRFGKGNSSEGAFVFMPEDTTMRGFSIYYPEVDPTSTPIPYPFTIQMTGNNVAVQDVELLNSFNGISAIGAHRHYISRVQGQPSHIGILVDQTYDIGRIEDVHWNPWYSSHPDYIGFQQLYGVGFLIARTDWEYVLNTFVFGMSVGYKFVESAEGSCNGNFVGIGADCCANASVVVEAADPWGMCVILPPPLLCLSPRHTLPHKTTP